MDLNGLDMPPDVWGDIAVERVSDNDRDTVVLCRSAGSRGHAAGARRFVGNAALGAPDRRGLSQRAPDRAVRDRLAQTLRRAHADGASAPYQRLSPRGRGRLRDRDGKRAWLGRMMELLFVEVLRRHASRLPAGSKGLLAALNDPLVGRALQLLH